MNLYLMRHAIAVEADGTLPDSQRPLTEKGAHKLAKIARALKTLEVRPDLVLTSPYLRARQTAEMVAHVLGAQVAESENLTPFGSLEKLVTEIQAHESLENLLIVGHEPCLSQWIGLLVAGNTGLEIEMKKAGVCKLSLDRLQPGRCATLIWLMGPAQLLAR